MVVVVMEAYVRRLKADILHHHHESRALGGRGGFSCTCLNFLGHTNTTN